MQSGKNLTQKYIIIGAGIAGLYTAYNILLMNPSAKITIYEKNNYIGGRIHVASFGGAHIPIGAGIGRKDKDHLLLHLLDAFKLKYNEGISGSNHIGHNEINIMDIVHKLHHEYNAQPTHEPFSKFAKRFMSKESYDLFVTNTGYSDFNNTDAYDLLFNYGIEDTSDGWKTVYVPWNDLISQLVKFIKQHKNASIKLNVPINNLNELNIYSKKNIDTTIIIATTISHVQQLLPKYNIYKSIGATNFMCVYGVFNKEIRTIIANKIPKLTVLNKPLQEIIPINPEKGVYMLVYNDDGSASKLYNHISKLNNTSNTITSNEIGPYTPEYNEKCMLYLEKLLAKQLDLQVSQVKLDKIAVYYWKEGTHYFKSLNESKYKNREEFIHKAQRPFKNMFVVGEVVAQHQGWTEGALMSVQHIKNEL